MEIQLNAPMNLGNLTDQVTNKTFKIYLMKSDREIFVPYG